MVQYIILVIACQVLFLALYDIVLKRATFFNQNRAYLILTSLLSFVLPFIQIPHFAKVIPATLTIPDIVLSNPEFIQLSEVTVTAKNTLAWYQEIHWLTWLFIAGVMISLVLFTIKLFKLYQIKHQGTPLPKASYTEVVVPHSSVAFSFFKYMFLGDKVKEKPHDHIIAHELVHIQQKHSVDLLYFEVLKVILWFNPCIYIYQKRITELHEFIADNKTSVNGKKQQYEYLLQEAFQTENISFINQFFNHSLIKKRIVMLQKSKSKKADLLRYTLMVPILIGITVYVSSCNQQDDIYSTLENESTATESSSVTLKVNNLRNLSTPEIEERNRLINLVSIGEYTNLTIIDTLNSKINVTTSMLNKSEESIHRNEIDVPFTVVAEKPMFAGCENAALKTECFKEKLDQHVRNTFRYPEEAQKHGIQGRVYINFRINTDGTITVLGTRGPDESLEAEARKIIEALPTLIPGKNITGETVNVTFAYPIVFRLS